MSQIHFIGGEKGGVGKSLVARLLAQYCIDRGLPFAAYDTDRSHGALLRFYAEYATPASVDDHDSLDRIVEAAVEVPGRRVLVDLAAQTHEAMRRWAEEAGLSEFAAENDVSLAWWHVMDSGRDSVDLLGRLLDTLPEGTRLVLVRNEVRGDRFELLDASPQLARALEAGAKVVTLRKLPESTMQKIDTLGTSFWAAVNHPDRAATGLGLLERQRVKTWLQRAYAALDGAEV